MPSPNSPYVTKTSEVRYPSVYQLCQHKEESGLRPLLAQDSGLLPLQSV